MVKKIEIKGRSINLLNTSLFYFTHLNSYLVIEQLKLLLYPIFVSTAE